MATGEQCRPNLIGHARVHSIQDWLRHFMLVSQRFYYKKALCVIIPFCRYSVNPDKGFVDLGS